jgi:hypothetical protein
MRPLFCLFILFLINLSYSESIKLSDLLLTAKSSVDVTIQEEKSEYLKKSDHFFPLIREAELRVGSKLSAVNRPEYTLRVQPGGFGETRNTRKMMKALSEHASEARSLRLNEELLERYMLGLNFVEYSQVYNLQEELILVYEDRIDVLEKRVFNGDADLLMVIDAEDELTKLKSDHIELGREIRVLKNKIASLLKKSEFSDIDTSGFADIAVIAAEVDTSALNPDTNNVYMKYYRAEFDLTKSRYDLERSESRRYVPYLDFSFDHDEASNQLGRKNDSKSYDMKKAYSVEFGLKIPFINFDRQTIARRKVDFLDDRESYEKAKIEMEDQMHKDIEDIRALIALYKHLQKREQEVDVKASLKKYLQMSGVDPLMILSIKESLLKNSMKMKNVKYSLMRNYVRVIDACGKLSGQPLRNYISSNKEQVE